MTMTARESAAAPRASDAPWRPAPMPVEPMTWEQWLEFDPTSDVDARYELVEGVPVMSPPEALWNIRAAMHLVRLLRDLEGEFDCYPNAGIRTKGEPASTGREPDLLVIRTESFRDTVYLSGHEVVLAVECVSAGSSDERDWVTKRAEYARAGVEAYLVVDRARGQLVLFDQIVDGVYSRRQDADPEVTVEIGEHRIAVRLDQLLE